MSDEDKQDKIVKLFDSIRIHRRRRRKPSKEKQGRFVRIKHLTLMLVLIFLMLTIVAVLQGWNALHVKRILEYQLEGKMLKAIENTLENGQKKK